MCEINPAHTLVMRLEAFTSNRKMSAEAFQQEVGQRVVEAEQALNADGKFRFHVHPQPEVMAADATCTGCSEWLPCKPMLVKPCDSEGPLMWSLYCEACEELVIAGHSDVVLYNA